MFPTNPSGLCCTFVEQALSFAKLDAATARIWRVQETKSELKAKLVSSVKVPANRMQSNQSNNWIIKHNV